MHVFACHDINMHLIHNHWTTYISLRYSSWASLWSTHTSCYMYKYMYTYRRRGRPSLLSYRVTYCTGCSSANTRHHQLRMAVASLWHTSFVYTSMVTIAIATVKWGQYMCLWVLPLTRMLLAMHVMQSRWWALNRISHGGHMTHCLIECASLDTYIILVPYKLLQICPPCT